ncbi:hypothetical protein Anapl_16412 [Anas platyrhynchos]|uniref:Uncharacterized protein n=1 Tax=Anas platyrhynchos TaxID=8839 RepID=R0JA39_ANAPL|nr:hypothetical protein Anapl_16412 [Anas platyrhynchos]
MAAAALLDIRSNSMSGALVAIGFSLNRVIEYIALRREHIGLLNPVCLWKITSHCGLFGRCSGSARTGVIAAKEKEALKQLRMGVYSFMALAEGYCPESRATLMDHVNCPSPCQCKVSQVILNYCWMQLRVVMNSLRSSKTMNLCSKCFAEKRNPHNEKDV